MKWDSHLMDDLSINVQGTNAATDQGAGFNRAVAVNGGVSKIMNSNLTDLKFGYVPGEYVGWVQGVPGLTDFPGGVNRDLPNALSSSQTYTWNSFQGADDVSFTKGIHAVQFGVLVERMQDNIEASLAVNGGFRFASLASSTALRRATRTTFMPRAATAWANAEPMPSDPPAMMPHGPYLPASALAIGWLLNVTDTSGRL